MEDIQLLGLRSSLKVLLFVDVLLVVDVLCVPSAGDQNLLFIVGELAGTGLVAVAVDVGDR